MGCNLGKAFLGEKLEIFLAIGPFDALTAKKVTDEARVVANNSGLPGAYNGQQDAFRHCYWNCRMAQEIGGDQAQAVGDLHELCSNNNAKESTMDYANNAVGRSYGTVGADCGSLCKGGIANGDLQLAP